MPTQQPYTPIYLFSPAQHDADLRALEQLREYLGDDLPAMLTVQAA